MLRRINLIGILSLVFFTGCNQASLMEKIAPQEESRAKSYIDQLRQNKFDQIEKDMDPSVEDADLHNTLVEIAAFFPHRDPVSVKVVGANIFNRGDTSTAGITLEYEFPGKWLLANVSTQTRDGVTTITGISVTPLQDSLENLNRFTFAGKGDVQYITLLLALLGLLVSVYAFILCLRTKIEKKKWLWALLTLCGLCRLSVDWTTGKPFFTVLAFQLPVATAGAVPYGSWVIHVSLPLGAIAFLILRRKIEADRLNNPA